MRSRRDAWFVILVILGALLSLVTLRLTRAQGGRPNLLVLSIDTLRADHVTCYGYDRPTTPTIDRMADNGTRFARARSAAPWTLPSFATMFTGRVPTRHGAGAEGPIRDISQHVPRVLAAEVPTLAESLGRAGYRTTAITSNPYLQLGPLRGFASSTNKTLRCDRIGAMARTWAATEALDQPWFLWVHFNDPHEPTIAADPFLRQVGYADDVIDDPRRQALERWGEGDSDLSRVQDPSKVHDALWTKRALYDATIRQVDTEIARLLEDLHRRGVLRNTVVVLVSDHGEEFLDHAEAERALAHDPRGIWGIGHGHTLYEEQLRVPLVLMGPGVGVDKVIDENFSLVDLMPTLLGLLRVPAPAGMDGVDRREWMKQRDRESPAMVAEALAYGPDWMAWIDDRYKLVTDRTGTPQQLFDLREDPREQHDLLAEVPPDSLPAFALARRDTLLRWSEAALADAPPPTAAGELSEEARQGLKNLGYVQ